jgi:hypothetical protein
MLYPLSPNARRAVDLGPKTTPYYMVYVVDFYKSRQWLVHLFGNLLGCGAGPPAHATWEELKFIRDMATSRPVT